MPHVETFTFGPGTFESMTLKVWISKVEGTRKKATARLEGAYTVFCGQGWTHEITVKEDEVAWSSENTNESMEIFELLHMMDTVDVKYDVAARLLDGVLEDWFDPCELEGEL